MCVSLSLCVLWSRCAYVKPGRGVSVALRCLKKVNEKYLCACVYKLIDQKTVFNVFVHGRVHTCCVTCMYWYVCACVCVGCVISAVCILIAC